MWKETLTMGLCEWRPTTAEAQDLIVGLARETLL